MSLILKWVLAADPDLQGTYIDVCLLCIGRPDRQRYALEYTGDPKNLPAALMAIDGR